MSVTPRLNAAVTGREVSLFGPDLITQHEHLRSAISGARVLIVGGAGSIGTATTRMLLGYEPGHLDVVDQNENSLAELVRDLRSDGLAPPGRALVTLPLDVGSATMTRFIRERPPYDMVLNFAALKHVRSEKDAYSLLQMLDTNLVRAATLINALRDRSPITAYFAVSTDKAASPVSLMGASKRLMEHLVFAAGQPPQELARVTSARFANVAFSDGSLLDSVLRRVARGQLVACPEGVRRYFISADEAAAICLLAAVVLPGQHLLVPRLQPTTDLRELAGVVKSVIRARGFEPREYRTEVEARANLHRDVSEGAYPLLLTPADTDGEKPFEEFVGPGEALVDAGLGAALAIHYRPGPAGALEEVMSRLRYAVSDPAASITKATLVAWLAEAVPELSHAATGRSLDDRV